MAELTGRVRVMLKNELFSAPQLPHAPRRIFVVEGPLIDRQGGLFVQADTYYDGEGNPIEGVAAQTLYLPAGKIDHAVFLGD